MGGASVLYRLFLFLLVPSFLALATPPWRGKIDLRFLVLVLLGLYLLGQVALQPTLEASGYGHLAVGWIALWLSLWLALRSPSQRRFLVVVLILLGALEAMYGLIQSVGGYDYIGDYSATGGAWPPVPSSIAITSRRSSTCCCRWRWGCCLRTEF